jgi:hypothetical protein
VSGRSHGPVALSQGKSVQPIAIAIPTEVPGALASKTDVYSSPSGEITGLCSQLGDKLFESLPGPLFTYGVTFRVLVSPIQCQNAALIVRSFHSAVSTVQIIQRRTVCKRLCMV